MDGGSRAASRSARGLGARIGRPGGREPRWLVRVAAIGAAVALGVAPAVARADGGETISLTVTPSTVIADGHSGVTLRGALVTSDSDGHYGGRHLIWVSASDPGVRIAPDPVTADAAGDFAVAVTSSTAVGSVTLTAQDGMATQTATLVQTAAAPAALTLALSPGTVAADGASHVTVSGRVTDAHGRPLAHSAVLLSASDTGVAFATDPVLTDATGQYTTTLTSSQTAGAVQISARDGGATTTGRLVQTAATSTVLQVLTFDGRPVQTDEPIVLGASVLAHSVNSWPAGTLTFTANGTAIPGCSFSIAATSQLATATCRTSFAAAQSPLQLAATFTPGAGSFIGGSAATQTVVVGPAPTTVTLSTPAPVVPIGRALSYTAVVTPAQSGAILPTGTVDFRSGGRSLPGCAAEPVTTAGGAQVATCRVSYSALGTPAVTALYSGDGNFTGAQAAPLSVTVEPDGRIDATMDWTFRYTASETTVVSLLANDVPAGADIVITCAGHGCPFARHRIETTRESHGTYALTGLFAKHRLAVGSHVIVRLIRSGWIGKQYTFTTRSRRMPTVVIACLAPGSSQPGVGC